MYSKYIDSLTLNPYKLNKLNLCCIEGGNLKLLISKIINQK